MAHACNLSYSGGKNQEARGSKPVLANSPRDPISKIPSQKRADGVTQGGGPEFKPQYSKTKTKQNKSVDCGMVPRTLFAQSWIHSLPCHTSPASVTSNMLKNVQLV
jgi:hypothetical protein